MEKNVWVISGVALLHGFELLLRASVVLLLWNKGISPLGLPELTILHLFVLTTIASLGGFPVDMYGKLYDSDSLMGGDWKKKLLTRAAHDCVAFAGFALLYHL